MTSQHSNRQKDSPVTRYQWIVIPAILTVILLAIFMRFINIPEPVKNAVPTGGDFVLRSAEGSLALKDLRGKVVIIYFGYAFCPDICPTSLGLLSLALNKLSEAERQQVQAIFISVDPERDTVERLKTYAGAFNPDIIGITGSPLEIAAIAQDYGVMYMKVEMPDSEMGYTVDHSSKYYLVDRAGVLSREIKHGTDPAELARIIQQSLKQ